jgi:hypothetical protein
VVSACVLLTCLLEPPPLRAEPVTVTGGDVQVSVLIHSARIHFRAENFFVSTGTADFRSALAEYYFPLGSTVTLGGVWRPTDLRGGEAVVNGVSYPEVRFGYGSSGGTFVTAPVTLTGEGLIIVSVPFSFTGFVTGLPPWACCEDAAPLFTTTLTGSGVARAAFLGFSDIGIASPVNLPGTDYHVQYVFADPIPEPGTLLLVGGAALALAARRRLRRRCSVPGLSPGAQ